jgi:sulfate adenylyltransferase subunit 2
MMKKDREIAEIWSRHPTHKRRLEKAIMIIRESLELCEKPYVAFSCGKDSSVLADLVFDIDPTVPLRFLSSGETRLLHDVDKVIDYFRVRGADVQEINIDRVFSEGWSDSSWEAQRKAGNRDMELLNIGYDAVFMGLRAQESRRRQISLMAQRTEGLPPYCYRYKHIRNGMLRICPLAEWKTEDVAAYLHQKQIPVLDWYEEHGLAARTTARLTGDAVRQNVMVWIKRNNPDGYHRLVERFPELKLFT